MQQACERPTTEFDRWAVGVLVGQTLLTAAAAGVDADDREVAPRGAHHVGEGTKAAPEIGADLDEGAALWKHLDGFLLAFAPVEPAGDVRPVVDVCGKCVLRWVAHREAVPRSGRR